MEKKFQTAIPVTDMNGSLQVKVESGEQIYPLGSEIPLTIINTSPHSIFLAIDSHIKLLMIEDAEWIEVKNVITYSGLLVISPQGTPLLDDASTRVQPEVNDKLRSAKEKELLRIVVTGEIIENDKPTGKLVGAYVDVYVTP